MGVVFISHGMASPAFVLNLRSWFIWLDKKREVTCIEIYKEGDTYQPYAFYSNSGNVVFEQHGPDGKPEKGRGHRGNGITYEEFLAVVKNSDKSLSEKQVSRLQQFFPQFQV